MSTKFMIVGAVSTLCLSVGLAGAETPIGAPKAPAVAKAAAAASERSLGPDSAPMPPRPMPPGPMCLGPMGEEPMPMQRGPMHHGVMPRGPMRPGTPDSPADADKRRQEWLTHALGLSAAQTTALGKLLEERRSRAEALRAQLHEADKKLAAALEAAQPVPATVGALLIEQRALMQKLEAGHGQADEALRGLLTAEQRAALDSLPQPGPRGRMDWDRGPMGFGRGPMGFGRGPMGHPPGVPTAPAPPPPDPESNDVRP
jgi:Spy/CpxP family protein refolding chaperone